MSVYKYRKTIAAPVGGVNYGVKPPYLVAPNQWLTLMQMRCRLGVVSQFPGWASILDSMADRLNGFGSLLAHYDLLDGTHNIVVGDEAAVYYYDSATKALVDISGVLTFAPTQDYPWHSVGWNDVLYLTNPVDGLHKWVGSGDVAAIGGSAPKGWHIRVLRNHLAVFGVDTNPWQFAWAALGSESAWTATATNDAGAFDVIDTPGKATGLEGLNEDLVGYKDDSIHLFSYIGGREVIGRRRMVSDVGLIGPYAIAPFTNRHFFMGDPPNFYLYEGGNYVDDSVGDEVREKVFGELSHALRRRCRTLLMESTFEILFMYPDATSTGNCNRVVVYNYKDDVWYGPFPIQCAMATSAHLSLGTVIDDIDVLVNDVDALINAYAVSDDEEVPLFIDSAGDIQQIGASDSDNGTAITRTAETGDHFLGSDSESHNGQSTRFSPSQVFQVNQVNLDFEDIIDQAIEFYIGYRMDLNDPVVYKGPYSVKSFNTQKIEVPTRVTGRWFRLKFVLRDSKKMSLLGYQFLFQPAGVR